MLSRIFFTLMAILSFQSIAKGHSFYSWDCCSDNDCGPVIYMVPNGESGDWMTTTHGTVLISPSGTHKMRKSEDGQYHVCMRKAHPSEVQSNGKYVICVYYPEMY